MLEDINYMFLASAKIYSDILYFFSEINASSMVSNMTALREMLKVTTAALKLGGHRMKDIVSHKSRLERLSSFHCCPRSTTNVQGKGTGVL